MIPPLTIVAYDVDCDDIEDLTDAMALKRLGIDPSDFDCAWKVLAETAQSVPSWDISTRLAAADVSGIIVRSFCQGVPADAKNLVLWRWADDMPHKVTIFDPEGRLPRDNVSWRRP
jgi:RES domain-containing protein